MLKQRCRPWHGQRDQGPDGATRVALVGLCVLDRTPVTHGIFFAIPLPLLTQTQT